MNDNLKLLDLESKNEALMEILDEIADHNQKIASLLEDYYELTGQSSDATVKDKKQVKKILDKYSQL